MKKVFIRLLSLLLCLSCALSLAEDANTADLDAQCGKIFKSYQAVGATLLVGRGDQLLYQRNYGYANRKDKQPVDDNTYFILASVSKFVTGIHVMQLVEQGLLDLDEDISLYLGYPVKNPYHKKTPLTLRTLMTHTSSLNAGAAYSRYMKRGLEELISYEQKNTKSNFYDEVPGSKYRYSNFGAGVLGSIIESVTGKNVNDSITEDLFAPLGIDAAYSASLLNSPDDVTYLYTAGAASTYRSRSKSLAMDWDPSVNANKHYRITHGSLWIRGRDLFRLAVMMCNQGQLEGRQVLQPETVAEMMSAQQGKGVVTADTPYGLCVHRESTMLKDRLVYGHQGMVEDILCNVYFEPQSGFIFVLLTNGCNNKLNDHVAIITRKLFELTWKTFGDG